MRSIAVLLISFYQLMIVPFLKQILGVSLFCRYSLSCSSYTKQAILRFGVLKGSWKGFCRILRCNPLHKAV